MPKVDFYIVSDSAPDAPLRFLCRLAEKAVDQGHRVYVQATSAEEAARLDDLLWTFGDRSFLPHEVATPASPSHSRIRVLIGLESPPQHFRDVLINLGAAAPNDFDTYRRIAEIVGPDRKHAARERYKVYRERGSQPDTHNV